LYHLLAGIRARLDVLRRAPAPPRIHSFFTAGKWLVIHAIHFVVAPQVLAGVIIDASRIDTLRSRIDAPWITEIVATLLFTQTAACGRVLVIIYRKSALANSRARCVEQREAFVSLCGNDKCLRDRLR
jgi:hypothetical protein